MAEPVAPAPPPAPDARRADPVLAAAAAEALSFVSVGTRVGLGTGRAAAAFIDALGARIAQGFAVTCVPTSAASERQARALGIPVLSLDEAAGELDLTVDGADEVAPNLDLIKGRGGALVRERIVAAASRRRVILIGAEKLVPALGARGPLPVEIIPMSRALVARHLYALGLRPTLRLATKDASADAGDPFVSENGNLILDCALPAPLGGAKAAHTLHQAVRALAGVVDTGLFLDTADHVIVGHGDGRIAVLSRQPRARDEGSP